MWVVFIWTKLQKSDLPHDVMRKLFGNFSTRHWLDECHPGLNTSAQDFELTHEKSDVDCRTSIALVLNLEGIEAKFI